jgi:hypothetical protein
MLMSVRGIVSCTAAKSRKAPRAIKSQVARCGYQARFGEHRGWESRMPDLAKHGELAPIPRCFGVRLMDSLGIPD